MKTTIMPPVDPTKHTEEIHFVDNTLAPREATDALRTVLDGSVNFYKRQYLTRWEQDHTIGTEALDARVNALSDKLDQLKSMMAWAEAEGYKVSLDGVLKVNFVK